MEAISTLRLARLQKGLTLDDVFFMTDGRVSPPRLSRIERGLSRATPIEAEVLTQLLGVSAEALSSVPRLSKALSDTNSNHELAGAHA
jgi:transcriptional regulator with XRE-family HTH domain